MVFLILDPQAVSDTVRLAQQCGHAVWVGADAITSEEHQNFVRDGIEVTRFSYSLANARADVIADALATIEEHHPSQIIWIQNIQRQ
jgi:hypothetical protein